MNYQSNIQPSVSTSAQIEGLDKYGQDLSKYLEERQIQALTRDHYLAYEQCEPVSTNFIGEHFRVNTQNLSTLASTAQPPFVVQEDSKLLRGHLRLVDPVSYIAFATSSQANSFQIKPIKVKFKDINNVYCARPRAEDVIEDILTAYKAGAARRPVLVAEDHMQKGRYFLIDGQNVLHAQWLDGATDVLAYVVPGGPRFALLAGIRINKTQGRVLPKNLANLITLAVHEAEGSFLKDNKFPSISILAEKYHVSEVSINARLKRVVVHDLPLEYESVATRRKRLCELVVHLYPKLQALGVLVGDPMFGELGNLVNSLTNPKRLGKKKLGTLELKSAVGDTTGGEPTIE
jgi:hypothetical protein